MLYAYIGGGATTTALLWQHARHVASRLLPAGLSSAVSIVVYEKSGCFGPGLPYSESNLDCHLVNMEADTISIDPEDREDFLRWMQTHKQELQQRYPGLEISAMCFPPRTVVGKYLQQRFGEAESILLRAGSQVCRMTAEVVDIESIEGSLRIAMADGRADHADRVVIATGHWDPSFGRHCTPLGDRLARHGAGGYFVPWPAQKLRAVAPPGETIAVVGTSLTAMDVAFTLLDEGGAFVPGARQGELSFQPRAGCRRVILHSRNGLLPRVRSTWPPPDGAFYSFTKDSIPALTAGNSRAPALSDVMAEFRTSVEAAAGADRQYIPDWDTFFAPRPGGDVSRISLFDLTADLREACAPQPAWNSVYHAIHEAYSPLARLFPRMSATDRKKFRASLFRAFSTHAGAMPAASGARIRALLASGHLRIVAGMQALRPDDFSGRFEIVCRRADGSHLTTRAKYLVNAIGQERMLDLDGSPLWRNLVRRGMVVESGEGGIRVDYDGSNAIDAAGRPSTQLFAIGAMTLGERIGSSALKASASFGRAVIDAFVRELTASS